MQHFSSDFTSGPLRGLLGILVILGLATALSTRLRCINFRIVASAFALQITFAILVLWFPPGKRVIAALSQAVNQLIAYSRPGIEMIFGPLAADKHITIFAIDVLPVIIFFSALMSMLYYLGIMQIFLAAFGRFLRFVVGTDPIESVYAAACILVGQTEAPLVVRPYLSALTGPQIFTMMVSGFASVAGSLLAAYMQMGIKIEYLLAANFMAAPGGLLMAKIIMPNDPTDPKRDDIFSTKTLGHVSHTNIFMAAAVGARDGLVVAVNIGAILIAFVSLIALLNGIIGGIGGWFGLDSLTLQKILGWIFSPLMLLVGTPWTEAQVAGGLFGEKLVLNEFVAYISLSHLAVPLSAKSEAIVTFALCGFANFSSIALVLGSLGVLIPERASEIARYGLRAVAAGSLANLMSAAIAGLVLSF
jgi:concentrative nucleoside transporter, CNT family